MKIRYDEYDGKEDLKKSIGNNEIIILRGNKYDTLVGKNLRLKINCSVGLSDKKELKNEIDKIAQIAHFDVLPDTMMDLSIIHLDNPLYQYIHKEIGCPVGTVPVYVCFEDEKGIDKIRFLEEIENQAQNGVSFMTLHFTAIDEIYRKTTMRNIPVISRGGSLVLRDMYINKRKQNILFECFDEMCDIFKKYSVTVSVGTTFRPSSLYDALDEVQLAEIKMQKEIVKELIKRNISVMMEGIGHISLHDIKKYVQLIRNELHPIC